MARRPSVWIDRLLLSLGLAAALVVSGGCDEKEAISSEDQRLFLSAIPPQTCPAQVLDGATYALDESAAASRFELVATVFADDGQIQEGVDVLIESSEGQSFSGETDERGQFRVDAIAEPRPPDFVEWTATAANGERSETETITGFFPFLSLTPGGGSTVECGEEFSVSLSVSLSCLVNKLDVRLFIEGEDENGDPATNYELVSYEALGPFEFDPDSTASNPDLSRLTVNGPTAGEIDIEYSRVGDGYGSNFEGRYVELTFRAPGDEDPEGCTPGTVILVFNNGGEALVTPGSAIGGDAGIYDLWSPPNDTAERVGPGILWNIVEASAP